MASKNTTNRTTKTIKSLVFTASKFIPPVGVTPMIFQPVYPTVFTVISRSSPWNSSL